jgi:hypothetical protein
MGRIAVVVASVSLLAACGGDDGGDGPSGPSLRIVAPEDGAMVGRGDDADAAMPGIQYDLRVRATGLERDEQIVVYLLEPVESAYAYLMFVEDGVELTARVPFIPGMNSLQARNMDGDVQSEVVSFTVME